jgi:hypothetical protein
MLAGHRLPEHVCTLEMLSCGRSIAGCESPVGKFDLVIYMFA